METKLIFPSNLFEAHFSTVCSLNSLIKCSIFIFIVLSYEYEPPKAAAPAILAKQSPGINLHDVVFYTWEIENIIDYSGSPNFPQTYLLLQGSK